MCWNLRGRIGRGAVVACVFIMALLVGVAECPGQNVPTAGAGGTQPQSTPDDAPRVLIIGSYERYVTSTSIQEDAIRQKIATAFQCAQIRADYLVSGAGVTGPLAPEAAEEFAKVLRDKWRDLNPNIIVTIDTLAFELMTSPEGRGVFPGVPVVFSGVCWDEAKVRERGKLVEGGIAGVVEHIDVAASFALMRRMQPDLKTVLIVGGLGPRGESQREEVRRQLSTFDPGVEVKWAESARIRDVIDGEAAAIAPNGAVLFLGHSSQVEFAKGATGARYAWPVPLYIVYETNLLEGTLGGVVVSSAAEGRRAGQMAVEVLSGKPIREIGVDTTSAQQVVFDHDNLKRWRMLGRVPQGAIIHGVPVPWWERWGEWVALGTVLAGLQAVAITGLLVMRSLLRRAEAAAQLERDRLRTTLEGSTDGFWDWDIVKGETTWSPQACELLGLGGQGAITHTKLWEEKLHPEDLERARRVLNDHLDHGATYVSEYRLLVRDGTYRWFRSRGVAVRDAAGRPVRMFGTLMDINAVAIADQRLRDSEARYRLLTEHSQDYIVHFAIDGRRLYRSPASERTFPLSDQERINHAPSARVHEGDVEVSEAIRTRALNGEMCRFELRAFDVDKNLRWLDMLVSPVFDADGAVNSYVCYARDISDRKAAEAALREAEERYSAMFNKHPYPMWVYDVQSLRFLEVNQAAIQKYGWTREEFLEMTILEVRPEHERPRVLEFIKNRSATEPTIGTWVHRTRDGKVLDVGVSTHTIPWKTGHRARVATIIDQTEKLAAERWQSRQREIMELVATGAPLAAVLESITKQVQEQSPEVFASVLLLQDDGKTMRTAAAPTLPAEYSRSIDGISIGPSAGSCGTAVYTGQRVIVSDIAQNPLWTSFRDTALRFGLRACWSEPVRITDGTVVGSLAMYATVVREPGAAELEVIASAAHAAGIAIERDRAQAALARSEAKFRRIFETAQEGIWVVDNQWRTTLANPSMGQMLGVDSAEMIGRPITEFMDDEGRRLSREHQERRVRGESENYEFKFMRADGSPLWVIVATNPIQSDTGEFVGALAMITDITERRAMEDALRAERRLFLSGPAIAWRWRVEENWPVEYVSENVSTLGYTAEEFMSGRLLYAEIVHPDDLERVAQEIRDHLENHRYTFEQEYRVRTRDGRWRTLEDHQVVDLGDDGKPRYFVGYTIDVTSRREAEDRLRESERTNRALIMAVPDLIFRMHKDGRYLACHTNTPDRLLMPPERFIGRTPTQVLPKQLGEQCEHHLGQLFQTGEPQTYEYELNREGRGKTRWEVRMTRSSDDEALLLIRDVTAARENERLLRQSEARLSNMVNSAPVGVISWSTEFIVTAWNPAAERIFGVTAQQAIGRHASFIIPDSARQYVDEVWRNLLTRTGGTRATNENIRADGSAIWCEWYNTPLTDPQGRVIGVASIVEDVTERRMAQRRQDLIMRELDHRVKNNLAAVISLAEQTGRSVKSFVEFKQRFIGRLNAMSRMHSALASTRWQGADLRMVVSQTLEAFSPGESARLIMEGPEVMLPPRAAQAITMALNELATNAAKYGALSGSVGRVAVRWSLLRPTADEPRVELRWVESEGPAVAEAPPRGFGSELIEGAIAHELRGSVQLRFASEGVTCSMTFPLRDEPVISLDTYENGTEMYR